MRSVSACLVSLLVMASVAGCSKKEPTPDSTPPAQPLVERPVGAQANAAANGAANGAGGAGASAQLGDKPAASAAESAQAPIGPAPSCKMLSQKSWGKGANKTTGLTAVELPDGRVAIGAALGLSPHVLVVGKGGEGSLIKVPIKEGTALAKAPKAAEGTRFLMRVTPVKVTDKSAEAFVDYRDEYKDKKRRVACGPADSDDAWIKFEGSSPLDRDEKAGKLSADDRSALFKKREQDADEGYHELRDCRTFSDLATGETWIVGSELRGFDKGEAIEWKASLVIDRGAKQHEIHLHEVDLKGDPPKVTRFEIPMSHKMSGGEILLATRFGGELLAAVLNQDKSLRGSVHHYPGFPTLPDMAFDGKDTVMMTSFAKGPKEFHLRGVRLSASKPELPKALATVKLDDDDKDSETDPDFTRDTKGQRWVSFVDGERGKGKLFVVPVDEGFHATGRHYEITDGKETASEARLVPLAGGNILVAYLRDSEGATELVTEELACDVVKLGVAPQALPLSAAQAAERGPGGARPRRPSHSPPPPR